MPRRPALDTSALEDIGEPFQQPVEKLPLVPAQTRSKPPKPSNDRNAAKSAKSEGKGAKIGRAGKKQAGYIPQDLHKELKILAVHLDMDQEELVEEAVRDLLNKYRVKSHKDS